MSRRKYLSRQQIAAIFYDSDSEDENVSELFSEQELVEAAENTDVAAEPGAGGASLDLPFELDDDNNDDIDVRDSEYQNFSNGSRLLYFFFCKKMQIQCS